LIVLLKDEPNAPPCIGRFASLMPKYKLLIINPFKKSVKTIKPIC